MIDFLNSFKSLIKLEQIHTDNNIFKLHYKFTVIMLIVFSILLTSKQYFGEPIKCDYGDKASSAEVIDTFCWILGSFILKNTVSENVLPGLGNHPSVYSNELIKSYTASQETADERIWQKYYQWVCIVFCFQALFFYLPRYLWKTWEGGRLRLLVKDLSGPLVTPAWNSLAKDKLMNYIVTEKYSHNIYSMRYFFCEILNLANVIAQIYFMDWFLTGQFSIYGFLILTTGKVNTMNQVFPKMAKCMYYSYGPSGTLSSRDALCVLPLNILNEKLFLILWFWLYILALLSIFAIFYRVLFLCCPKIRSYLLMGQIRFVGYKQSKAIVNELTYGDFFLLYNIGKNVNPIVYKELIMALHENLKNRKTYISYPDSPLVQV